MSSQAKSKVIVELPGGLGNQIFALSAGIVAANGDFKRISLDLSRVDYSHAGEFDIREFINISNKQLIKRIKFPKVLKRLADSILFRFPLIRIIYDRLFGVVRDSSLNSDVDTTLFLRSSRKGLISRKIYIKGYFQNFNLVRNSYKEISELRNTIESNEIYSLIGLLNKKSVLALHIRGGDFLNTNWRNLVGVLSPTYFANAISLAKSLCYIEEIWIFTNDRKYVSTFSNDLPLPIRIIDSNEYKSPVDSFLLMGKCKAIVASNSTFSYLAAFMSEIPEVVIILSMFSKSGNQIPGIPNNWIQIEPIWSQ